jgi:hypothetical protein
MATSLGHGERNCGPFTHQLHGFTLKAIICPTQAVAFE